MSFFKWISTVIYYISNASNWYCCHCLGNALPFNHILEDDICYDALYCKDNIDIDRESFSPAMFHLFDITRDETSLFDDFDPDVNYHNDVLYHISTESKYLSEDKFRGRIQLDTCKHNKPFSGISETWLNDPIAELYCMNEYTLVEKHRNTKVGGGVALLCQESIEFIERKDLGVFNDHIESLLK